MITVEPSPDPRCDGCIDGPSAVVRVHVGGIGIDVDLCPSCRAELLRLLATPTGERRPCKGWVDAWFDRLALPLGDLKAMVRPDDNVWTIFGAMPASVVIARDKASTMEAAQLAAEDAIRSIALAMLAAIGGG